MSSLNATLSSAVQKKLKECAVSEFELAKSKWQQSLEANRSNAISVAPWTEVLGNISNDYAFGDLPEYLNVGSLSLEPVTNKVVEHAFNKEETPALIRLRSTSGIDFSGDRLLALENIQSVILRLLVTIGADALRIVLMDRESSGLDSFRRVAPCFKPTKLIGANDRPMEALTFIHDEIEKRNLTCLAEHDWVWEYNAANPGQTKPYYILLMADEESGLGDDERRLLEGFYRNANAARAGVYIFRYAPELSLAAQKGALPTRYDIGAKLVADSNGIIELLQEGWIDTTEHGKFAPFMVQLEAIKGERLKQIHTLIKTATKRSSSIVVKHEIKKSEIFSKVADRGLTIPIGRSGASGNFLMLGDGCQNHHALVGGTTGSGKSVLLHQVITSAALLYSPEELRFVLLDYKEGTEFAGYRDLPHVFGLSIGASEEWGMKALKYLVDLISKRGEIMREDGDIATYKARTGKPLERYLVIIDEFQVLLANGSPFAREAASYIETIVRRGRSFGINMILSSQSLGDVRLTDSTRSELATRICLRMAPDVAGQFLTHGNRVPATFTKAGQALVNEMHGNEAGNVEFQSYFCSKAQRSQRIEMAVAAVKSEFPKRKFASHVYELELPLAVSRYSQQKATGYCLAVDTSGLSDEPVKHSYAKGSPKVLVLGSRGLLDSSLSVLRAQVSEASLHVGAITDDNQSSLDSVLGADWQESRSSKDSVAVVRVGIDDFTADNYPLKWSKLFAVEKSKGLVIMTDRLKSATDIGLSLDDFNFVYVLTEKRVGDVGLYQELADGEVLQFAPKTGKHRTLKRIVPD